MASVHIPYVSFTGGEFSPSLHSRTDLQKYSSGLRRCRNMIIHPTGGISNRQGTIYVATTKLSTNVRLITFEYSITQVYVIEIGYQYMRFYKNGLQIQASGLATWSIGTTYARGTMVVRSGTNYICLQNNVGYAPESYPAYWTAQNIYEIGTNYADSEIFQLKFVQSGDTLFIVHKDHPPYKLERYGDSDWRLSLFDFTEGPFRLMNTSTITMALSATSGTSKTLTASSAYFTANHVGALFKIEQEVQGGYAHSEFTTTGDSSEAACFGTWRLVTGGTWTGDFLLQKSIDEKVTWTDIRKFYGKDDKNYDITGDVEEDDPYYMRVKCTALTSGTLRVTLTTDSFVQTAVAKVTAYTSSTAVTVDILKKAEYTSPFTTWAEGAWSAERGYPSCVTFYQDRLAFACTKTDPQTVWFSETGNYTSFARHEPLEDTDGISINLSSRKMNAIRNLVGISNLIGLTANSEWVIGSDEPLTPTTVTAKVQSYRGCADSVEPIVIGNRIIYIQRTESNVRDLGYDFNNNGFTGDNINIFSNHLIRGYDIVDMDYQEEPDSLIWLVRDDGILLSVTYMREQEVLAWSWHDTQGYFKSVTTVPTSSSSEVWFVVQRGGSNFIERMPERSQSTEPCNHVFLDSAVITDTYQQISAITSANPAVITSTSHGLSDGDYVDIHDVVGMTELNGRRFKVANKTTHTFRIKDYDTDVLVDSSSYETYVSGGKIYRMITTRTGMSHLAGYTCNVLADGFVLKDQTITAGEIALGGSYGIAHAGLSYTSELETLNLDYSTKSLPTTQGKRAVIPSAIIKFENSRGGYVGPDEDHLDEIVQRTDEGMGEPTRLSTEDRTVSLNCSYSYSPRVFFRQTDPLPIHILAIIPNVTLGG